MPLSLRACQRYRARPENVLSRKARLVAIERAMADARLESRATRATRTSYPSTKNGFAAGSCDQCCVGIRTPAKLVLDERGGPTRNLTSGLCNGNTSSNRTIILLHACHGCAPICDVSTLSPHGIEHEAGARFPGRTRSNVQAESLCGALPSHQAGAVSPADLHSGCVVAGARPAKQWLADRAVLHWKSRTL